MKNFNTYWYSVDFLVGTPPQKRTLLLDTGSSWLWTWADECINADQSDRCKVTENRFHVKQSTTFEWTGEEKYIKYGSGSASGPICTDNFLFAGHEHIRAEKFEFFL